MNKICAIFLGFLKPIIMIGSYFLLTNFAFHHFGFAKFVYLTYFIFAIASGLIFGLCFNDSFFIRYEMEPKRNYAYYSITCMIFLTIGGVWNLAIFSASFLAGLIISFIYNYCFKAMKEVLDLQEFQDSRDRKS